MIVRKFDTEDDWLDARLDYVTSTDIAALFGCSRGHSLRSLWLEKKTRKRLITVKWEAESQFGKWAEMGVADDFQHATKLELDDPGRWTLFCDDELRIAASVDRLVRGLNRPVECKTAWNDQAKLWDTLVPIPYQLQNMTQQLVLGSDLGYFSAWLFRGAAPVFRLHPIERDDVVIDEIKLRAKQFWTLVDTNTPPPIDGTEFSAAALRAQYAELTDDEITLDSPILVDFRDEHALLGKQIKEMKDRHEFLRQTFIDAMGNHTAARLADGLRVWCNADKRGVRRLNFEKGR